MVSTTSSTLNTELLVIIVVCAAFLLVVVVIIVWISIRCIRRWAKIINESLHYTQSVALLLIVCIFSGTLNFIAIVPLWS